MQDDEQPNDQLQNPEEVNRAEPAGETAPRAQAQRLTAIAVNPPPGNLYPFWSELRKFSHRIESLYNTLPLVLWGMYVSITKVGGDVNALVPLGPEKIPAAGGEGTHQFRAEDMPVVSRAMQGARSLPTIVWLIPESYVVTLISQYDAFLGRVIRTMFKVKPEMLKSVQKTITVAELLDLDSVESAKEHIADHEIENVLRDSHVAQFVYLENKLGITLRSSDLTVWKDFVEITERRNLFVHTSGIVSKQYINNCEGHGVKLPKGTVVGSRLSADLDYFTNAYRVVLEIGVKLAQVLWRKLVPEEQEAADTALNNFAFDLVIQEEYDLAVRLIEFALKTYSRGMAEANRFRLTLNLAQAHKWAGRDAECKNVLRGADWSACRDELRIGKAVLGGAFDEAAMLMKRLGPDSEVTKLGYNSWPIFKDFRASDEFKAAYEDVFGEAFVSPDERVGETFFEAVKRTRLRVLEMQDVVLSMRDKIDGRG